MITLAQRIEQLRTEREISRPALSAALGFPKTAIEKFETGRQTPSQEQQNKMAAFFGVSTFYLRGESNDRTQMDNWMDGAFMDVEPKLNPIPKRAVKAALSRTVNEEGSVFDAFLSSKKFQESLRLAVLDVLSSPEGQQLIAKAVSKERSSKK